MLSKYEVVICFNQFRSFTVWVAVMFFVKCVGLYHLSPKPIDARKMLKKKKKTLLILYIHFSPKTTEQEVCFWKVWHFESPQKMPMALNKYKSIKNINSRVRQEIQETMLCNASVKRQVFMFFSNWLKAIIHFRYEKIKKFTDLQITYWVYGR